MTKKASDRLPPYQTQFLSRLIYAAVVRGFRAVRIGPMDYIIDGNEDVIVEDVAIAGMTWMHFHSHHDSSERAASLSIILRDVETPVALVSDFVTSEDCDTIYGRLVSYYLPSDIYDDPAPDPVQGIEEQQ